MIKDFLNRNNNLDAIILIFIGMLITLLVEILYSICKKTFLFSFKYLNKNYRNFVRKRKGNYTLNEIEVILKKPENKRNKKEKMAIESFDELNKLTEETRNVILQTVMTTNNLINKIKNNKS